MFINNAQSCYAQTELLYAVWKRWQGLKGKHIWNISTQMTLEPVNSIPNGLDDLDMSQYRVQKLALEEASKQLSFKNRRPVISIIKPGGVNTQGRGGIDVQKFVDSVIKTFSNPHNIHIMELSLGPSDQRLPL